MQTSSHSLDWSSPLGPDTDLCRPSYRNRGGQMVAAEQTFTTKGDATAWLAKVQTDQSRGSFVDPRAGLITLTVLAEQFLEDRVLAERTLEGYRGLLDIHILPTLGDVEIGQLSPAAVRAWHARLARRHPSTAAKAYRLLRAICNTAVSDEPMARSPCRVEGAGTEQAEGGPLRPHVLQKHWSRARLAAGRSELHLHDLLHTGNTWAAATGASTRELMSRMGARHPRRSPALSARHRGS